MLHWFLFFGLSCGVSFYVAHSHPAAYLRWQEAIAWSTHALSLGLLFGIGVIFGRYGFTKDASGAVAEWLLVYGPIVTLLYIAALLYHELLCSVAQHRKRDPKYATRSFLATIKRNSLEID